MQDLQFPTTAGALGRFLGAPIIGDSEAPISSLSPLQDAGKGNLTFFAAKKLSHLLGGLKEAVLLTSSELVQEALPLTYIVVENPKRAFAEIAKKFLPPNPWNGISEKANIHPSAKLAEGVHVGPFAVICEGVSVGAGTVIYPHAYIGPGVQVGESCEIHPQVVLLTRVKLGNRVRVFSGSVLGSEGFGYLEGDGGYIEMPQIGWVVIEDEVRIGAKCTIDRSTLGDTRIKKGSKLDDQVHIGHNCQVGERNLLCAQVGLAGSTTLEEDVLLGGQVGLAGHLTVGKGARMAGQTGSSSNLKGGETYLSSPAMPIKEAIRIFKHTKKLPDLAERVRKIEEQLNEPK